MKIPDAMLTYKEKNLAQHKKYNWHSC